MDNQKSHTLLLEQLKKYRKHNNYTQGEIADLIGVGRSAYSNYENGTRLPDVYILDKLARIYNLSIEAFLYPPSLYNSFQELHDLSYDHGRCPDIRLNEDEEMLIYYFRHLDERDRDEILHACRYKKERGKSG